MTNPFAQAFREYRDRGWTSPILLPPMGKFPPPTDFTGYDAILPSPADLQAWAEDGGNIGLHLRGNVVAIDIDDHDHDTCAYHGGGSVTLAELEAQWGELPATWSCKRQGAGPWGHRYFRLPSGVTSDNFPAKAGKCIDIVRHGHKYSVVWPSVAGGRTYGWYDAEEETCDIPARGDLPELPMSWCVGLGWDAANPEKRATRVEKSDAKFEELLNGPRPAPVEANDDPFVMARSRADLLGEVGRRRRTYVGDPDGDTGLWSVAKGLGHLIPHIFDLEVAREVIRIAMVDAGKGPDHKCPSIAKSGGGRWTVCDRQIDRGLRDGMGAPATLLAEKTKPVAEPTEGATESTPEPPKSAASEAAGLTEEMAELGDGIFLSEEFWKCRPVFKHLRAVAQSKMASPEGVLVSAIALALANTAPNVVLPACVGVEASLNVMTVLCGGSGDGKSVCAKLADQALRFTGCPELHTFPPSSGQGLAGQYQYLKKERGQPPQQVRSRYSALAVVEESDTIRALSANSNSTLSSELRKAAMGETIGFGNVGETQTNLKGHDYRFVLMMCMQPELAGWLLGDAAGGLPQRFLWACVRDPRVVRDVAHPEVHEIVMPFEGRLMPPPGRNADGTFVVDHEAVARGEKIDPFTTVGGLRPRYVMPVSEKICPQIVEAAIQRKVRGDDAGVEFDGHAILLRLKVAAGLALLEGRKEINDDDWELSLNVIDMSNASRAWVQSRVADAAIRDNVKLSQARAHGRIVEDTVVEKAAKGRCARSVLSYLERAGGNGMTKAELRGKLRSDERHLLDDGVLDGLMESNLVRFEDIFRNEKQVGSRWFRVA